MGKKLYTYVTDRDGTPYDDSWDTEKILARCKYDFVVRELKRQGHTELRECLMLCWNAINEVRTWANYIKHKGGIDYKYLEPENPIKLFVMPMGKCGSDETEIDAHCQEFDTKYEIKDFKSPIEIDVDDKIPELVKAHTAIYECIEKVISEIDFEQYVIQMKEGVL